MNQFAGLSESAAQSPSTVDFEAVFDAAPGAYMVLDHKFNIVAVNEAYLAITGFRRAKMVGRGLFDVFPDKPDNPAAETVRNLSDSLRRVLRFRRADAMPIQRYDTAASRNRADGLRERHWSPVNTPVFNDRGEVAWIVHRIVDVTDLVARDRASAAGERLAIEQRQTIDRLRRANIELAQSENALRASEARFRAAVEAVSDILWTTDARGSMVGEQAGWQAFTGQTREACQGFGWADAVHPDEAAESIVAWESAIDVHRAFVFEHRVRRHDGAWRLFTVNARPVLGPDGAVSEWVGVHTDITDARQAEERRKLLLDELNHRVKNSLATVQSIARHTLKSAETPEAFCREFSERLTALSRSHDLLTRGDWRGANLKDVISQALAPYRGGGGRRVALHGDDVQLDPKETLALGIVLHELSTNAAKYGALSTDSGQVEVMWEDRSDGDKRLLRLVWTESGGPTVGPRRRTGLGSVLIERGLSHELGATTALNFNPGGLQCHIDLPRREPPPRTMP